MAIERVLVKPDGHTLLGFSDAIYEALQRWGEAPDADWYWYIIGGSPYAILVAEESDFRELSDLVSSARLQPGSVRIGSFFPGTTAHIALLGLESAADIAFEFRFLLTEQAFAATQAGTLDAMVAPLTTVQTLVRGGALRPLGVFWPEPVDLEGMGFIPSVYVEIPELQELPPISQFVAMGLPPDSPEVARESLQDVFDALNESDRLIEWAKTNAFILSGETGQQAKAVLARFDEVFSVIFCGRDVCRQCPDECEICLECQ